MKSNIGSTDKIIRLIIAIVALAAKFFIPLTGVLGIVAIVVAAIALVTGLMNFCPLWAAFGINTNKKK